MFWNKKDEEIIRLRILLVENTAKYNEGTKRMESYVDLILSHLKLKYVPETETKEPAKLVEKTNINLGVDFGHFKPFSSLMDEYCGYPIYGKDLSVFTKPKKKSEFTGSEYRAVYDGWIITPPPKKRSRPKKK